MPSSALSSIDGGASTAAFPTPQGPCRILILTSSTGGGHDRRAYAFKAWTEQQYPGQIEVTIEHLLEKSHWLPRLGVHIYNFIQQKAPGLHNIYWHIAELYAASQQKQVGCGRRYYCNLLTNLRPHVVFSVHDCLNRGYFQDARRILGSEKVTCVTYCGEWSGGFGYSRNWVDPSVDLFISRTAEARHFARSLGVSPERDMLLCNFMPPAGFDQLHPVRDKPAIRRDQFKLDPHRFTLLLATGQVGANNHFRLLSQIIEHRLKIQVIAICGRNRKAYERLQAWHQRHPRFPLHIEGFSNRMPLLLEVSDAVVTRGGANTTAEALFHTCPMIFNCLGGVMPQERLTINYFMNHGAASRIDTLGDFPLILKRWQERKRDYRKVVRNLRQIRRTDTPQKMIERILALAARNLPAPSPTPPQEQLLP